MRAAAAAGLPAGITSNVTGRDALDEANKHGSSGGSSVLLEALIGGLGALVILLFVFGTLPAVLMPLVVAVAAILNTFTLVWALTYITDVSIIVQFLIALVGLGVAIDYALLMIFRFRDELREGERRRVGARRDDDPRRPLGDRLGLDGRARPARDGRRCRCRCCARWALGGMLIPVVSVLASLTLLPAMLAVLGHADQQRPGDAAALRSTTAIPRTARGAAGRASCCAGRSRSPRSALVDRRRARRPRDAAEPERGAAEVLPGHRHGDRRPRRSPRPASAPA